MDDMKQTARKVLIAGLRNAHATERQAVATLEPQIDRLDDYPEFQAKLREHVAISRDQEKRIDIALRELDATSSPLKAAVMGAMGFGQARMQAMADDAALKAALADLMFEHFEIGAYRSLLELCDLAETPQIRPALEQILHEEEEMADWLAANLPKITRRYVELEHAEDMKRAEEAAKPSALDHSSAKDGADKPAAETTPAPAAPGLESVEASRSPSSDGAARL